MGADSGVEHLAEGGDGVVEVMAGNLATQLGGPFLAVLFRDFVEVQRPKFRPSGFDLVEAEQAVFLALAFDRSVGFKLGRCEALG